MVINLAAAASTLGVPFVKGSTLAANLDANASLYAAAQAGDQQSLDKLTARSGVAGLSTGYAPQQQAREDARAKLQALVDGGYAVGANPVPPQALAPTGVKYTVTQKASGTSANQAPGAPPPSGKSMPTWVIVGGVALVVFLGFRYFKRG